MPPASASVQRATLSRGQTPLFAVTIFLSACLLFEIQPIAAKTILPWFGGGVVVWTTSMLFFQVVLLLGYLYAHFVISRLRNRTQAAVHIFLIAASLVLVGIRPATPLPLGHQDPALRILGSLAILIGLPYFVLSATTPLLQAWYSRGGSGTLPYRFFAISNLGSVLALVCYPVVIEPFLGLHRQGSAWSGIYAVFAVLCAGIALKSCRPRSSSSSGVADQGSAKVRWADALLWILLPGCSSALLLSVTNHLCQDVAPIPFLWVLPLALYLFTFVLTFETSGWYRRRIWIPLLPAALLSMVYTYTRGTWELRTDLLVFPAGLFVCCMFCHGELASIKPPASRLTLFYSLISLGGAIGGFAVSIGAPKLFIGYSELPVALAVCCGLALARIYGRSTVWDAFWAVLLLGFIVFCVTEVRAPAIGSRIAVRNFYGVLRVRDAATDKGVLRRLYHGKVLHGSQFQAISLRKNLTTYYSRGSGVGVAIEQWRHAGERVGVVGLGAGTIAAYARAGDTYRFFEINPQVIDIAQREFTYLRDCQGSIDVIVGDARLSLNQDPTRFDVLVVDAFSGDAIPTHLLTREAVDMYLRHLSPGGVMAFHVTNRFFDLAPEVAALAKAAGQHAILLESEGNNDAEILSSSWVLVSTAESLSSHASLRGMGRAIAGHVRSWTDDYTNLMAVLRWPRFT